MIKSVANITTRGIGLAKMAGGAKDAKAVVDVGATLADGGGVGLNATFNGLAKRGPPKSIG
jgi:hypothetical protein